MKVSGALMLAAAVCFTAASVDAAQGPRGQGRGQAGVQGPAARGQGPATQGRGPARRGEGPAERGQGPKADHPRGPRDGQAAGRPDRDETARGRGPARANEDRTIADNIARNPQLEARLTAMLPSGMTLEQAAEGFRNQGQFIAALQTSKNQNVSFVDLKAKMTGDNPLSLGQALQELRPESGQQQ